MPYVDIPQLTAEYDAAKEQTLQAMQTWTALPGKDKYGHSGVQIVGQLKQIKDDLEERKVTAQNRWLEVADEISKLREFHPPEDLLGKRFLALLRREADAHLLLNQIRTLEESIDKWMAQ